MTPGVVLAVGTLAMGAVLLAGRIAIWRLDRRIERLEAEMVEAKARRVAAYHSSHRQLGRLYQAKMCRFLAERRLVEMRREHRLAEMRLARSG